MTSLQNPPAGTSANHTSITPPTQPITTQALQRAVQNDPAIVLGYITGLEETNVYLAQGVPAEFLERVQETVAKARLDITLLASETSKIFEQMEAAMAEKISKAGSAPSVVTFAVNRPQVLNQIFGDAGSGQAGYASYASYAGRGGRIGMGEPPQSVIGVTTVTGTMSTPQQTQQVPIQWNNYAAAGSPIPQGTKPAQAQHHISARGDDVGSSLRVEYEPGPPALPSAQSGAQPSNKFMFRFPGTVDSNVDTNSQFEDVTAMGSAFFNTFNKAASAVKVESQALEDKTQQQQNSAISAFTQSASQPLASPSQVPKGWLQHPPKPTTASQDIDMVDTKVEKLQRPAPTANESASSQENRNAETFDNLKKGLQYSKYAPKDSTSASSGSGYAYNQPSQNHFFNRDNGSGTKHGGGESMGGYQVPRASAPVLQTASNTYAGLQLSSFPPSGGQHRTNADSDGLFRQKLADW